MKNLNHYNMTHSDFHRAEKINLDIEFLSGLKNTVKRGDLLLVNNKEILDANFSIKKDIIKEIFDNIESEFKTELLEKIDQQIKKLKEEFEKL